MLGWSHEGIGITLGVSNERLSLDASKLQTISEIGGKVNGIGVEFMKVDFFVKFQIVIFLKDPQFVPQISFVFVVIQKTDSKLLLLV